ncbi:glyoxalase [Mangrovactinospora gilvigrisea]|uniref:Glyoxalase n=1 Tax=Mangrovactinospora gilvigrisea TaxID=1428644 RepID=A0A1J7C2E1_9ACTN|nr:VOC family protein [Mangrovactinospora gilvigrisea]OIV35740.1 glyoxalase [Mangrovactinospora gilvigrisea]
MSTVEQPRFDAVGVVVADLPRAVAFYRLLGVDFPEGSDAPGAPHAEAVTPSGVRLMLDPEETVRSFDPEWTPPSGAGRIGLAFHCGDAAGVDAAFDRVVAAGHRPHLKPFDAPWGQRYASVCDPDGNAVDLFA